MTNEMRELVAIVRTIVKVLPYDALGHLMKMRLLERLDKLEGNE